MDREDYERIVRTHMDTIYRIAVSYTKTPADADDIVQQTFVKLLSKKETFTDEEHEKRWLIRVCINECNSFFSSFWRRNVDSMDTLTTEPRFTTQENTDLYDAIKSLPSKCSIVVYLFYYEGYSTKEIGKLLHIKEATVRTRLVRARKLLKEQLKEAW
ncbi:MAG: RNA polymerase sigma factor [Lachnospiraceae bacterium]|nr:RNA polymerase sigma factor [Lachnospiraceae bacterium]